LKVTRPIAGPLPLAGLEAAISLQHLPDDWKSVNVLREEKRFEFMQEYCSKTLALGWGSVCQSSLKPFTYFRARQDGLKHLFILSHWIAIEKQSDKKLRPNTSWWSVAQRELVYYRVKSHHAARWITFREACSRNRWLAPWNLMIYKEFWSQVHAHGPSITPSYLNAEPSSQDPRGSRLKRLAGISDAGCRNGMSVAWSDRAIIEETRQTCDRMHWLGTISPSK
jgi:hypothetical protein